jgi:hypothetical protein
MYEDVVRKLIAVPPAENVTVTLAGVALNPADSPAEISNATLSGFCPTVIEAPPVAVCGIGYLARPAQTGHLDMAYSPCYQLNN